MFHCGLVCVGVVFNFMCVTERKVKGHLVRTHPGGGGYQVAYTFPLRITCKKKKGGGGGPDSMQNCGHTKWKDPNTNPAQK